MYELCLMIFYVENACEQFNLSKLVEPVLSGTVLIYVMKSLLLGNFKDHSDATASRIQSQPPSFAC